MKITSSTPLSDLEKINWIRLVRTENIGPSTFFRLLEIFETPIKALENLPEFVAQSGSKKSFRIATKNSVENELEKVKKYGAEILTFADEAYPRLLREIYDPAPVLTIFGKKSLLNGDMIGIVGPRNATFHACGFAQKVAADLGQNEVIVVSGLAKGVDTSAHRGSLETGTVGVIAGGIDNIYPAENAALYKQIGEQGVIVSEQPFGSPPKGGNFIQRNRIISGMSYAILVVEAGMQSGSLATARFALEQGREVFAVPGFPADPRCHGSNGLLEDGAIFTQNAARILREIPILRARFSEVGIFEEPDAPEFIAPAPKMPSESDIKKARSEILQKIGYIAMTIEDIIATTEIPARLVNIALVQLELMDEIQIERGRVVKK